jgi:NADH-quinone oxidoreductase subunit H
MMGVIGYVIILIFNIVCMLLVTMIIASLTLIERKVLSLVQRRVGPFFVGYRGRLQYIADALKLFIKGILVPDESNKF